MIKLLTFEENFSFRRLAKQKSTWVARFASHKYLREKIGKYIIILTSLQRHDIQHVR